jgi:hypothetical protein
MSRARELPGRPMRLQRRMHGLLMRDGAGELGELFQEQAVRAMRHPARLLHLTNAPIGRRLC